MPLFLIRRPFRGASEADLNAAAFRALTCLPYYEDMRWERSYRDPATEEILCVYQAQEERHLRMHAERSLLPCDEIRQVDEVLPETYGGPVEYMGRATEGGESAVSPLFLIRRPFAGATPSDLDAAALRALACAEPRTQWQRSFWDPIQEETLCVYRGPGEREIRHHSKQAGIPCAEVRQVEEILP
jgi:Protein of unknown function (DUF4242)